MTSDETSAFDAVDTTVSATPKPDQSDVIEAAAKVIADSGALSHVEAGWIAKDLHAAGLLAEPADRDEYRKGFYEGADAIIRDELADPADKANEAFTWRERALHWKADKERAEAEVAELRATIDAGEASDGYHTHRELYEYRMLYNAAAFNAWARDNRLRGPGSSPEVVKSWTHSDGESCFGSEGEWFIVVATLPTGQISNHYRAADWDLFRIPEGVPPTYDGHTPEQAAQRLRAALDGGEQP